MITVARDMLTDMLKKAGPAVAKRSTLPVLNCVLLTARGTALTMAATDLGRRVELTDTMLSLPVDTDIAAAVPYRDFADVLKNMKGEVVNIERANGTLSLADGRARAKLNVLDAVEFPPNWTVTESSTTVTLSLQTLTEIVRMVGITAADDEARPTLQNIHVVTRNGQLVFEATDGYRLATYTAGEWADTVNKQIPSAALDSVPSLFDGYQPEDTVTVEWFGSDENNIKISIDNGAILYVAGLVGNFPDVTKIIPTQYDHVFSLPRAELLDALKLVGIFAKETANIARLSFEDEYLSVFGQSSEKGEAIARIASKVIKGSGKAEIAHNCRLLESGLAGTTAEMIHLAMTLPSRPMAAWAEDSDKWFYLQMPMHTNR